MKAHIKRVGPCDLAPKSQGRTAFEAVARSIVFQQLAGNAAQAIWKRTQALVPGPFTAPSVLSVDIDTLRTAGLSQSKARSLHDLAERVDDGRVNFRRMARRPEEAVVEELSQVRGVGRWTAQMFCMFHLGRLDVWPGGDLGVRNGYRLLYELEAAPLEKEMPALGERFAPYRSVAAWYCWRAVDTLVPVRATDR